MPAAHTRSLVPWLLLAVLALIVYGSLYPFNFKSDAIAGGVLEALRQLSWARAGRGDRVANVLLYVPLGFCLFLWLEARLRRGASLLVATLLGTLVSLAVEVAQVYISIRVPSLADLALNSAGTALGAAGGLAWGKLGELMHLPTRTEKPIRDPGAALLLALWLAWRLSPFVPQLDLAKLKAALQPLIHPQFDLVAVFVYLTCWLVINQAIAAIVSRPRRLELLLMVIAAVMVGQLLVTGHAFVASELVALLWLLPIVVLMHRLKPRPRRAALMLGVLTVLIIDGLAPFDFTASAVRFDLWPFLSWLEPGLSGAIDSIRWPELFGKLFLYGALVWLTKEWGATLRFAIAFVTSIVFAIEVLQMWLPQQTASITDPALALAVGLVFSYLYGRAPPRSFAREAISPRARSR